MAAACGTLREMSEQRAKRAGEMLETAIRKAEALGDDWSEAFARPDAGQGRGRLGEQPSSARLGEVAG